MSSDASYRLDAPARDGSVDLVHELIDRLWTHEPAPSAEDRIRFEMAVIEIVGNIIEHAARIDPPAVDPRRFELAIACTDGAIEADVSDDGKPVEIDLVSVTMPGEDAESGRGLALAQAAVDELSYDRVGPRNHWRLVCHRS